MHWDQRVLKGKLYEVTIEIHKDERGILHPRFLSCNIDHLNLSTKVGRGQIVRVAHELLKQTALAEVWENNVGKS